MANIIVITHALAIWANGDVAIDLHDLPETACQGIMESAISRLQREGLSVKDRRLQEVKLCERCHSRPPKSTRAKYCIECQVDVLAENKRRWHQALAR